MSKSFIKSLLSVKSLKYLFSFVMLGSLFFLVDLKSLVAAFSQVTLESLGYLFAVTLILLFLSARKWKLFLEAQGADVSVMHLCKLYMVGYFVNLMVPSYVGGDVVRSWYAGKKVGQHQAFTATILERYTGLVAMVSLGLAFIWFVDFVTWQMKLAIILVALGLLVITVLALSPKLLGLFDRIARLRPILKHIQKIQDGLNLARKDHLLVIKAMFWSYAFHCSTVLNVMAAAYAVGWANLPIQDLFVVLPLVLLIGAIPIAPSGLGIQEGAFYFFLTTLGATPAQALGVGLILRAKVYVVALLGGLVWLDIKYRDKKAARELPPELVVE